MTRSKWAWRKSRTPLSAPVREAGQERGLERQARRVRSSGLTTASFTTRLMTFLATSLLVLGATPAVALAGAKNDRSEGTQSNSQISQQSTPTRQASAKLLASGAGYRSASGSVAVRALQRRLAKAGYGPGPIDGRYGPETMQAVDRFQAAAGLAVNGIAGPVTLGALGHPPEMLSEGAGYTGHGSRQVRELQRQLAKHGYAPGPADGRYGPQTMNAVARFQAAHGLIVDGIAGPITLTALSNPRQALYEGTGYGTAHGSARVRALQRRLVKAGDQPGPIDGRYGPDTRQAVARVQAAHGLPVNGVANSRTLAELRPSEKARKTSPRPTTTHQPTHKQHHHPQPTNQSTPRTKPASQPSTPKTKPASQPSSMALLLAALAVTLGLVATLLAYRERRRRHAGPNQTPTTTPDTAATSQTATPDPTAPREAGTPDPRATPEPAATPEAATPQPTASAQAKAAPEPTATPQPVQEAEPANRTEQAARAFTYGLALQQQGRLTAAISAYNKADQLGHPHAATNLGVALEAQGDPQAAYAAYKRADQRGDPDGTFNLALLLEQQEQPAAAIAAYERADQRGHPSAATNLGVLLETQGDQEAARQAYEKADRRGDPSGTFNLAVLLEEQGHVSGALAAYERAAQHRDTEIAEMARAATVDLQARLRRAVVTNQEAPQNAR